MADTRVVLPACPCPIRARLRRLAPSYTFTGCLLPQAYGKGDTARNEDEYRVQASPTTPAKLLMLTQGFGREQGTTHEIQVLPGKRSGRYSSLAERSRFRYLALCAIALQAARPLSVNVYEPPS